MDNNFKPQKFKEHTIKDSETASKIKELNEPRYKELFDKMLEVSNEGLEETENDCTYKKICEQYKNILDENDSRNRYASMSMIVYFMDSIEQEKISDICADLLMYKCSCADSIVEKKHLQKLDDHVNLSIQQSKMFAQLAEDIATNMDSVVKAEEKISEFKNNFNKTQKDVDNVSKKIKKTERNLYVQLISIVAIFVGISFVMFGGMTMLNGLFDFSEMEKVPIDELICLGSLLGIVLISVMYVFFYMIMKITNIESKDIKKANNVVIIAIVILSILMICTYNYTKI